MRHVLLLVSVAAMAQAPPARVLGTVTAINAAASELSIQSDHGDLYGIKLSERAVVIKLPPGETNLTKGTKIQLADLIVGDRVLARGELLADQKALIATSLIVNRKEEIAKKQERDREEWLRRGVLGVVTEVDLLARKITIESRRFRQVTRVVVTIKPDAAIRRYAEDSVRFADAKPSTIEKIQVKDQLRALGEKSADNTAIEAEDVVFGTFQTIAGRVTSVDAANNRLTLDDPQAKRKLLVKITPDTNLRELPPFVAAMMSGVGPGAGGGMNRPGGNGPGPGPGAGQGPGPGPGSRPGAGGGGFRGGAGGGDPAQMLERFPKIELGGLKPGDAVMVSSTVGAQAGELTAITLVAGVEAILTGPRSGGDRAASIPGWSLDIGLPQ